MMFECESPGIAMLMYDSLNRMLAETRGAAQIPCREQRYVPSWVELCLSLGNAARRPF